MTHPYQKHRTVLSYKVRTKTAVTSNPATAMFTMPAPQQQVQVKVRRQRKWKRTCLPVKRDSAVWKWWEAERISKLYKGERLQQSPRSKSKQEMTSKLKEHTKTQNTNEASGQQRRLVSVSLLIVEKSSERIRLCCWRKLSKQKAAIGHIGTKSHPKRVEITNTNRISCKMSLISTQSDAQTTHRHLC